MIKHHRKPCRAATSFIVSVLQLVIEMLLLLKACACSPCVPMNLTLVLTLVQLLLIYAGRSRRRSQHRVHSY